MPVTQRSKELHPLCHEHHIDMRRARIDLMIEGEFIPTPAHTCPVPDCRVHYAASLGYFIAAEYGQMERDMTPRLTCTLDGQPMYLAETNPEVRSFRLWRCPRCDTIRTNEEGLVGGGS